MTERTKGPAVSMRRPPTRGPQDPWTPRVDALAAIFGPCRAGPPLTGRRPTCISMAFTLVTGKPRTPPRCPRCQNWLAGFPEPRTLRGTPTPCPAAHVAFFFIGLAGLPVSLTPRETPHPAALPTLPKLAVEPAGTTYAAGNSTPSRDVPLRSLDWSFSRHWIFVQNFWGGEGENEGETGRKILRGFQQGFQGPWFCSLGR